MTKQQLFLRISMLISGTFMLTYTTSPIALTDGLELLLNPLKKLRFPVHEMTIMIEQKNVVGVSIGSVTLENFCQPLAPSIVAASYSSAGTPCRPARYMTM